MAIIMNKLKRIICLLMTVLLIASLAAPASAAASSGNVAVMSVFAWTKNAADPGHAWLYFENTSKSTITVGKYKLAPGKAVSVGIFMNSTRKEGRGVYYNLESYLVNKFGASGRVSISQKITSAELKKVTKCINKNNTWTPARNCSWFAAKVWNTVADKKVGKGSSPAAVKAKIKSYKETKNKALQKVSAKNVYKQKSSGLKVVRAATLKKSL